MTDQTQMIPGLGTPSPSCDRVVEFNSVDSPDGQPLLLSGQWGDTFTHIIS